MNLHIFLTNELFRTGLPLEGSSCFCQDLSQAPLKGLMGRRLGSFIPFSLCSPNCCGSVRCIKR